VFRFRLVGELLTDGEIVLDPPFSLTLSAALEDGLDFHGEPHLAGEESGLPWPVLNPVKHIVHALSFKSQEEVVLDGVFHRSLKAAQPRVGIQFFG
jgi:hypothetical protein